MLDSDEKFLRNGDFFNFNFHLTMSHLEQEPVRVALLGIGGFGSVYCSNLFGNPELQTRAKLVAAVDPFAETAKWYPELAKRGIPVFRDIDELFRSDCSPELCCIATPIQFHKMQTIRCLEKGIGVLLEKPFAGSSEDCREMIRVRDETDGYLSIGFQWSSDPVMRKAKADRDAGAFGKPIACKALVMWPRDEAYYKRGIGWAGRRYATDGTAIFDSVASNATAHYLFNMLWFMGQGDEGCLPADVAAIERRANEIETYDTIELRSTLDNGVKLLYLASHAAGKDHFCDPCFEYTFEKGVLRYNNADQPRGEIVFTANDGTVFSYGQTNRDPGDLKIIQAVDNVRKGRKGVCYCPPELALKHILMLEAADKSCGGVRAFPADKVWNDGGFHTVTGLAEELRARYAAGALA